MTKLNQEKKIIVILKQETGETRSPDKIRLFNREGLQVFQ